MIKYITLRNGMKAIIDSDDWERCQKFNWGYTYGGRYVGTNIRNNSQLLLHRFIMKTPKGFHTDHINGNPLDNRKKNLRICSASQNQFNSRKIKFQTSKYKGVCWYKRDECWRAYINIHRKQIHLGYFSNEIKAAKSYNTRAKKLFGKYAFVNVF